MNLQSNTCSEDPAGRAQPLSGGSDRFQFWSGCRPVLTQLKVFDSKRLWSNQTVAASKGIWADFEAGGTGWLPNAIQSHFEPFSGLHNENIFKAVFSFQKRCFLCFSLNLDWMKADCPVILANRWTPQLYAVLAQTVANLFALKWKFGKMEI